MKHKTPNRIIIHVRKKDIYKEQSELLKKDINELLKGYISCFFLFAIFTYKSYRCGLYKT